MPASPIATARPGGNFRAVLGVPAFRRVLAVRLASQLADGLFQAGLGGSLLFNPERQAGALATAVGFAVLLVPYSLIGPYVGVFLDRWDRRAVVYLANLVRAALVVPAALFVWTGDEGVGYAVLALIIIGLNRFFLAGLSAALPHVVQPQRLVTGNAMATTLGTLTFTVGLGLAGLALNTVVHKNFHGYGLLAATAALGYTGSALLARASFTPGQLGPDEAVRPRGGVPAAVLDVARGMLAGAGHLSRRRPAAYAVLAQAGARALYGALLLAVLLLYRRYLFGDDTTRALTGLAEVLVAGGLGALLAAFVTPVATRRLGGWRWITALLALAGVAIVALGTPFSAWLLVAATFVVNFAAQGTRIVVDTSIQRQCADDYRGRVFSLNDTLYNLSFVAGVFAAALALPADGHSYPALVALSAGYLVLAGWYGLGRLRLTRAAARPAPVAARDGG